MIVDSACLPPNRSKADDELPMGGASTADSTQPFAGLLNPVNWYSVLFLDMVGAEKRAVPPGTWSHDVCAPKYSMKFPTTEMSGTAGNKILPKKYSRVSIVVAICMVNQIPSLSLEVVKLSR